MKILFLCLANSKKWNNRCLGGIEVSISEDKKANPIKHNGRNKWIRPVSLNDHGEIDENEAGQFKPLNVLQIETTNSCPDGFQIENTFFRSGSIKLAGNLLRKIESIEKFLDTSFNYIFINDSNRLSVDEVKNLNHSIIFIKPEDTKFYLLGGMGRSDQLRVKFNYKVATYDLPVTDLEFEKIYQSNPKNKFKNIYFCISLGGLYHGYHYKLVAGVIQADTE